MGINDRMKCCAPCSTVLLSGLDSVEGNGAGGSSEQLPGDRNSRTTLSTCGLKIWLILGSTTWATILSTPCSSIPDLRGTVWFNSGLLCNKHSDYWILCDAWLLAEQQWNGSSPNLLKHKLSDVVSQLILVQMRAPCVVREMIWDKVVHSLFQI